MARVLRSEGFAFEGTMQFVPAKVVVDRAELQYKFKNLCTVFIDNWEGGDYEHLDELVSVKINGQPFAGTIINMNQFGRLILKLDSKADSGVALALGIAESSGQYFYVRTYEPDSVGKSAEQGVMVHDSRTNPDGPTHCLHADAIVAFSYLE